MNNPDMEIIINEQRIDYELENEKTIGEVLKSIITWLEKADMRINSIQVDEAALTNDQLFDRPINTVRKLQIESISNREYQINFLEYAQNYLIFLNEALNKNDQKSLSELSKSYEEMRSVLFEIIGRSVQADMCKTLDSVFLNDEEIGCKLQETGVEISQLNSVIKNYLVELVHPEKQMEKIVTNLVELAEKLDEVAIQLQTGQDKVAMAVIIHLVELLQAFMRCLVWMEKKDTSTKLNKAMNDMLAELEEALKTNDTVLIGDILEYEIKPFLIELPDLFAVAGEIVS